jgi:hypothetical protein
MKSRYRPSQDGNGGLAVQCKTSPGYPELRLPKHIAVKPAGEASQTEDDASSGETEYNSYTEFVLKLKLRPSEERDRNADDYEAS